jgi:hypothetical protein
MEKLAQQRGITDWMSEKLRPSAILEKVPFLNDPGFKEVMDKLRKVDDDARSIALGKNVGVSKIEIKDVTPLKDLLKETETNIKRHEYMKATAYLGRFHKRINDISNILEGFQYDISNIHEKFLMEGLDEETKSHLKSLHKNYTKANYQSQLIKEGGVADFFHNLLTQRGRALSIWEKRYPKMVQALKKAIENILKHSKSLYEDVLKNFDSMSTARNRRSVEDYETGAIAIVNKFKKYDAEFSKYYAEHVKKYINKLPADLQEKIENEVEKTVDESIVEKVPDLDIKDPAPFPSKVQQAIKAWKCSKCNNINDHTNAFCKGCGKQHNPPPISIKQKEDPKSSFVSGPTLEPTPTVTTVPTGTPSFATTTDPTPIKSSETISEPKIPIPVQENVSPTPLKELNILQDMGLTAKPKQQETELQEKQRKERIEQALKIQQENKPKPAPVPVQNPLLVPPKFEGKIYSKKSHIDFINSLESFSNESPLILKKYILKYASMINDEQISNELINVANKI